MDFDVGKFETEMNRGFLQVGNPFLGPQNKTNSLKI